MKLITLSKALFFWLIIGHNASVLCAGEPGKESAKQGAGVAKQAEGTAKAAQGQAKSDDKRRAITLDVEVKSCNQYSYSKSGDIEKFTVSLGFKIEKVVKGTVTLWNPSGANKYGKEVIINLSKKTVRVTYL